MPAQTRKRGRAYHTRGHVLELECVAADQSYAAVVRGSEDYEVSLEFADKIDRKSTRLNSSHLKLSRMPSSA